jgi:hypothetical protein
MSAMAAKQAVPISRYFEVVMVEMVTLEEMVVMDCLVLNLRTPRT